MRKIITNYEFPPIPTRMMDWLAYFDGNEEGPQGWGPTEEAAVEDLLDNLDDEEAAEEFTRRQREADASHFGGLSELGEALAEIDDERA